MMNLLKSPNTFFNYPKRNATGFDLNRLQMLLAILDKKYGINVANQDVYLNIAGGLRITETAADLAVCLSIVSSSRNFVIPSDTIFVGEVNLSGFVSPVSFVSTRLEQAKKYGIKKAFIPNFSYDPEFALKGKVICVKGRVLDLDGTPAMFIEGEGELDMV